MTARAVSAPFTMDTACTALGICRRRLQELVKKYPRLHYPNGNRKLFTDKDIEGLREAMRREGEA